MHEEETSTSSNNGPIWKHIWSVKVVPKCRILVWRACKNIIPVRMNLKKWMVDVDSIRSYSGDTKETMKHMFLYYEVVKPIWFASQLSGRLESGNEISFIQWIVAYLEVNDTTFHQNIFGLLWSIWNRRNKRFLRKKNGPLWK